MMTDLSQYRSLTRGVGYVVGGERTTIELTGDDRISFLQNLCTNDVARLEVGQGCEAFALNAQGKIVGHVHVFREADRLVVDGSPGQAEALIEHFDRYLIREKVRLLDVSDLRLHFLVAGRESAETLRSVVDDLPVGLLDHVTTARFDGIPVVVRRIDGFGPEGFWLTCPADVGDTVGSILRAAGLPACDASWLEVLRIENKTPRYGTDVTSDNLPQEVDRDRRAISFTKGCYLGQETVARIDALGHVNRKLAGLQWSVPEIPPAGTELFDGEKVVGKVTSSTFSPRHDSPISLAYVRKAAWNVGSRVTADEFGTAEVIDLPDQP